MEQLGPLDLEPGDVVAMGAGTNSTPQHSPSIPQSMSKNKLGNKKSVDPDSDSVGECNRTQGVEVDHELL